jgi:hypothetical protein
MRVNVSVCDLYIYKKENRVIYYISFLFKIIIIIIHCFDLCFNVLALLRQPLWLYYLDLINLSFS